ncbi:GNAT family N-acetyltransferase [Gottschalkia acidurici]|uniref:GNAT family N-acetyltransferase n=1 Tax=Clostridium acidurici TaxID=1556 RepID=UPI0002F7F5EA|nr:GNAT family N-acetyltransferase [Gottschalkia acidurici]
MIENENKIVDYNSDIQEELEAFFKIVLESKGQRFEPEGRHSELRNIENVYSKSKGGFWIYKIDKIIVGTVAIRPLYKDQLICELKNMYVLPKYQGKKVW